MNYQVFSYMPNTAATSTDPLPRPIRVTPSALSPLLYAILYSIEFQSPVGPRPATLRSGSSGRTSGVLSGAGGATAASTAAATAPSAAALLTSAVSVMSSFWGRSSTTNTAAATSTAQPTLPLQQSRASQPSTSAFAAGAGQALDPTTNIATSPARTLTLAEEAELAALQRQHEQPFVVPVTQVLHKLGGVHITVRETHNPTITTAYARAMEEVEMIVAEHEQRLTRQSLRSASFPSQPGLGNVGASPGSAALLHGSSHDSPAARGETTAERVPPPGSAGGGEKSGASQAMVVPPVDLKSLAGLPASPTSPSRSTLRVGSPFSAATASAWATASRGSDNGDASRVDEMAPSFEEVGLVLSVRLLSKEVTRWRITHERPLAEWRFPIIRTASERMVIRPRGQGLALTSSSGVSSAAGGGATSQDGKEGFGDTATSSHDFILVNDAAQIHQVLEFILKSSYQTTSMETFTDFTCGELVFDAHVQERRRFN